MSWGNEVSYIRENVEIEYRRTFQTEMDGLVLPCKNTNCFLPSACAGLRIRVLCQVSRRWYHY